MDCRVLDTLAARSALRAVIEACSILVDGIAARPDTALYDSAVLDVLPPFAGG